MYSETCLNRSCSKAETLLRRTDTFDPVSFLYAFLSRISKAKNCKEDTASDGYFQSSGKNVPCLTQTQIKILEFPRNRELNSTFLSIFSKEKHFFTKQQFFFDFTLQFMKQCNTFDSNSLSFIPNYSLQPTNNYHWKRYRPSNHTAPLYELLVSVLWLTLSFSQVSKICRRMHLKFREHVPL